MIDPKLQAELRTKFNPDGSNLRNAQLRMLNILKYVDDVCKQNDILYWLSSGTCLGAVRHGGFIPWDDDVDIEMLEEDYDRLITILENQKSDEFALQTHKLDKNFHYDFAKVRDKNSLIEEVSEIDKQYKYRGYFIDIFPLIPSGSKKLHYWCGRLRVLEYYIRKWCLNHKGFKPFIIPPYRLITNTIIAISKRLDIIGSSTQIRHTLGSAFIKPRDKKDIFPLRTIKFEDVELPIPGNVDSYLRKLYGNYMEMKIDHIHIKSEI